MRSLSAPIAIEPMQALERLLTCLIAESAHERRGVRDEHRQPVQAPVWLGVPVGHTTPPCAEARGVCVCQTCVENYRPLHRAWATNLSMHGLSLLTEHDLPLGVRLCVNLEALAGEMLILPMRTIYCKQILPATYRVGGSFL